MLHWSLIFLLLLSPVLAEPFILKVTVAGVERRALVFPGNEAYATPTPVVLAFHGFSGSHTSMATTRLHRAWPQATVVYPLGLPTFSQRHQRNVPAWQPSPGRDGDRDVLFIDVLLEELRQTMMVDSRRIFAAGLSNGALFCYVLLVERPRVFAGFAGVAGAVDFVRMATIPRPVLMIQGKNDMTVTAAAAQATRDLLLKINGCGNGESVWSPGYISYEPCASGQPVIWRLHDGGHDWPEDASGMIVKFFQELGNK